MHGGLFLANLAVLAFSQMSGDNFLSWGWRLPFALSLVLVAGVVAAQEEEPAGAPETAPRTRQVIPAETGPVSKVAIANGRLNLASKIEVGAELPTIHADMDVRRTVTAATAALPGKTFNGVISAVDTRVDATARTLRVEATLPNDANVLKPGGLLVLMCFSDEEPGEQGPRRVSKTELHAAFTEGWVIESIEPTRAEVRPDLKDLSFSEGGPKMWFAVIRRKV